MRRLMFSLLVAMMGVVVGSVHALAPIPDETGYLTDQTGIIEPASTAQIQLRLARYHIESQRKISVLLVQETPDEELEAYADRVLQKWGLAEVKSGAALLLWSAEGYILIRATDPLLRSLGREAQSEIISRWIVPAFAEGDAGQGILDGVERMIAVIAGEAVGERPQAHVPEESLPLTDEAVLSDEGHSADIIIAEPPLEKPAWIEMLPSELVRLTDAISVNTISGTRALFTEAGRQLGDLRVQVQGVALQLSGERVEPPMLPFVLNAFYVLGAVLGLAGLLLFRRAWSGAVLLVAAVGAPALWAATGFTALALCVVMVGVLFPLALRVLLATLGQEAEGDSEAQAAAHLKAQLSAMASRSKPGTATPPAQTATSRIPAAPAQAAVHVSPAAPRTMPANAQEIQEFTNLLTATVRHVLSRARLWHLGVAVALCLFSFGLAVLAGLALLVYFAVQRGVVYKFLELGARRDDNLRRFLGRFPAPDPADLKPPARETKGPSDPTYGGR